MCDLSILIDIRVVQKLVMSNLAGPKPNLNLNQTNYLDMNPTIKLTLYKFKINGMMQKIRSSWSQDNSFDIIFLNLICVVIIFLKIKI